MDFAINLSTCLLNDILCGIKMTFPMLLEIFSAMHADLRASLQTITEVNLISWRYRITAHVRLSLLYNMISFA